MCAVFYSGEGTCSGVRDLKPLPTSVSLLEKCGQLQADDTHLTLQPLAANLLSSHGVLRKNPTVHQEYVHRHAYLVFIRQGVTRYH